MREFPLKTGKADYLLYVDAKAIGVIEAKPDGHTLKGVELQSDRFRVDVKKGYKAALRRAGLTEKNYRFHDLRHTFATRLIERGVDPFTVQELGGHASIVTTQRYAHPNRESKRRAVASLGDKE